MMCLNVILSGFRRMCYLKHLLLVAAVVTVSSICTLISTAAIAFLLDHTGHAMSWFSSTFLLFGVYAAPACCAMLSTCVVAKKLFYKVHCITELPHFYFFHVSLCKDCCLLWHFCLSVCLSDLSITSE